MNGCPSQRIKLVRYVFMATVLCVSLLACGEEPPLKVGFLGGITGRVADLGVAGRDAVQLAIEEKNQSGGVNGRQLELLIRDDQQDGAVAVQAVQELINEGVVGIIGPMTSSVAVKVQPLINKNQTVMISPTAKTDQLSGQDDYFLRVSVQLSQNAKKMAAHVVQPLGLKRFAVVYDVSNKAFTETWLKYFTEALKSEGGGIVFVESFNSQQAPRFLPIAERILEAEPEGVLLLSNAIDTALCAQQIRKLGGTAPLFASEWAFTVDLISFGGRAVNGMTSFHSFNADNQDSHYLEFKKKFTERFGYAPSFATVLAYDATTFLFAGLEKQPSRSLLKEALLNIDSFQGLQSDVNVDSNGDVQRKLFLTVIEDGQFKVVE